MSYANILDWAQARTIAMGGLFRREGTGRFVRPPRPCAEPIELTRLAVGSGGAQCVARYDRAWFRPSGDRAPCAASGAAECRRSELARAHWFFRCELVQRWPDWRERAYRAAALTPCSPMEAP